MIYPWHQNEWDQFKNNLKNTHHGILLSGQNGIGISDFFVSLSQLLLCDLAIEDIEIPCGKCQSCRLFSAGSHPDFHVITTEYESINGHLSLVTKYGDRYLDRAEFEKKAKHSRVISVDQVRKLTDRFSTHSHISAGRVALIYPADRMNANAANALLKLLEEPPLGATFILVSSEPNRLPATIRSRCINHALPTPDVTAALLWLHQIDQNQNNELALNLANGAPILARNLIDSGALDTQQNFLKGLGDVIERKVSPVELASKLVKLELEQSLLLTQRFITDLVIWRQCNRPPFWWDTLRIRHQAIPVDRLFGLYDRICYYRRIAREPVNAQLIIEDLLFLLQRSVVAGG